ncbi:unnamed protein product [Hydatigera taeniaeformis]|uniref:non-specific protein-tyrosine kinase n=1 Tax=Hydatigena taeniaeformis TaxID=6205 RepID=A0A0R3X978_HYDTA|nr:unnamed protein product [Hydatigera taeniaeformis]
MVQSAQPDEMLTKFLKFVQLEDCLELLADKLEVTCFADLKKLEEDSLRKVLGGPATKRLLKKYRGYKNKAKDPKPSEMRPLSEFLAELNLKSAEDELRTKLFISRLEHFEFATQSDLEEIMDKDSAQKILRAYSKENMRKLTEKARDVTQKVLRPIFGCVMSSLPHLLTPRSAPHNEINVEVKIEKSNSKHKVEKLIVHVIVLDNLDGYMLVGNACYSSVATVLDPATTV